MRKLGGVIPRTLKKLRGHEPERWRYGIGNFRLSHFINEDEKAIAMLSAHRKNGNMPRNARVVISNYPHHIIQRGHNRQVVFASNEGERNLSLLMKRVSGRQTRYLNYIEKRTGTLWEGRYKFSPISTDEYLLSCCRYVELNPVRAGIVPAPEDYRWSSYGEKGGLTKQELLDFDPVRHV